MLSIGLLEAFLLMTKLIKNYKNVKLVKKMYLIVFNQTVTLQID